LNNCKIDGYQASDFKCQKYAGFRDYFEFLIDKFELFSFWLKSVAGEENSLPYFHF
jgi:predicted glycosyltransferase involved in capsule biosynthesis